MPLPDANNYSMRIYELLKETDLENLSYAQFQGVAEKLFIEPENEDEMRRLVLVQLARMAVRGDWNGFLSGGGGTGAPTNAEYVVMQLNGTLTNERKLTAGSRITISDGGAGGNVTIAADASPVTSLVAGTNVTLSPVSGLGDVTINAASSPVTSLVAGTNISLSPVSGLGDVTITAATPTGLAPNDASYLTLGLDGDLTNERVLTAGTGISFTDTGPNGTLTIESTGGGGGSGYQPVLPDRDGSFPASNRELYLVSCMPPWGNTQSSSTSSTTASDSPYFRPFISPVTGTVTEIQVNVNSDTDTPDYTIGIYSDSGGLPNSKIAEGTISISATGVLALTSFTGTPALVAGTQYHFAWVRKDTSGAGNFTAETASTCFKYASVSQTYPNLASVGDTGSVVALSGSNNVLPATVSTGNLSPFSNNPIRFGLRWD
tara:strand:+ start:1104 stop:2402 length:1299 start_codon:yes stop_codon:yes gene_type:complete